MRNPYGRAKADIGRRPRRRQDAMIQTALWSGAVGTMVMFAAIAASLGPHG